MDGDEEDDDEPTPKGGRNKGRPDGRRKDKAELNKKAEQEWFGENTSDMIKSEKTLVAQQLKTNTEFGEYTQQDKVHRN